MLKYSSERKYFIIILMGSDIEILAMKTIPYYTVMFYGS